MVIFLSHIYTYIHMCVCVMDVCIVIYIISQTEHIANAVNAHYMTVLAVWPLNTFPCR